MAERRPFHETIVDMLNRIHDAETLDSLGLLILRTKIPKNHDAIIEAWLNTLARLRERDAIGLIADLYDQKREAEAKAKEMAERDEAILREQVRNEARQEAEDARIDCN